MRKPKIFIFGFVAALIFLPSYTYAFTGDFFLSRYIDIFWPKKTNLFGPVTDSSTNAYSTISNSFIYNDLIHLKKWQNHQEVAYLVGETYNNSLTWLYHQPFWGFQVSFQADGYYGIDKQVENKGFVQCRQALKQVNILAWKKEKYVSGGLYLGKSFSDNLISEKKENEDQVHERILTQMHQDLTLNYAIFLQLHFRSLSLKGTTSRLLNHVSLPLYELFSNQNFKTFPLAAATKASGLELSMAKPSLILGISLTRYTHLTDTIVESDNALPFYNKFITRELGLQGALPQIHPSLFWDITLGLSGGYVVGKSGDFKYLIIDGIKGKTARGVIESGFRHHLKVGILGEYISGKTFLPSYLRSTPFSSWTVFRPQDYRFSDIVLDYYEFGLVIGKKFNLGTRQRLNTDFAITRSGSTLSMQQEEKKILVLIPVYTNKTKRDLFDLQGWNLTVNLDHQVTFKALTLNTSFCQTIPIWKKRGASSASNSGSSDPNIKKRIRGGAEYKVKLAYQF